MKNSKYQFLSHISGITGEQIYSAKSLTTPSKMLKRKWSIVPDCLREFMQNAMDSAKELPKVFVSDEEVVIYDIGKGTYVKNLIIDGVSEKEECARGRYGEGIKSAVAAILLLEGSIEIYAHDKQLNKDVIVIPTIEPTFVIGKNVGLIKYNVYLSTVNLNIGVGVHIHVPNKTQNQLLDFFKLFFIDSEREEKYSNTIKDNEIMTCNISICMTIEHSKRWKCGNFYYRDLIIGWEYNHYVYVKGIFVENVHDTIFGYDTLVNDVIQSVERNAVNRYHLSEAVYEIIEQAEDAFIYRELINYCLNHTVQEITNTLEFEHGKYSLDDVSIALLNVFGNSVLVINNILYDRQTLSVIKSKYKYIMQYVEYERLFPFKKNNRQPFYINNRCGKRKQCKI